MKRFFKFFAVIALSGITVASCYDDSALQASIKELQDQMKEANKVLDDLKSGKVITSVSATDNGYTFTMSDGSTLNVKNGDDGESASVIEAKLAPARDIFRLGESKDVSLDITGVEIIDAFAPAGWAASVSDGVLSVTAPRDKKAARNGSVVVVSMGGNSLVLMTLPVGLSILDVNGAYWDALIDSPQYGGPLLYGDPDEYFCYHADYTWSDEALGISFSGFGSNWGSVCFSSGGEVISNYVVADFKDASYTRQLEVSVPPVSGGNFIVHFGDRDDAGNGYLTLDGDFRTIQSIDYTITNYLANSAIYGDGYFGPLAAESYIAVKAIGYDEEGSEISSVSTVLIDGADVAAYLAGTKEIEWKTWDLSGLGEVASVAFQVYGSEDCYGEWGFNAPAYFAYTDVVVK